MKLNYEKSKMNHTITVEWEQVLSIICHELSTDLDNLKEDLEKRKSGNGMAYFHHDQEKDIEAIEKHIDALQLVLEYYRG